MSVDLKHLVESGGNSPTSLAHMALHADSRAFVSPCRNYCPTLRTIPLALPQVIPTFVAMPAFDSISNGGTLDIELNYRSDRD